MEACFGLPCPPLPTLPARLADSHKGDYGHALLIGGSRGMSGAVVMAGLATARTGAGWVSLAVPDRCLETVAAAAPYLMTIPLDEDQQGRIATKSLERLEQWFTKADCIAIGPDMGRSRELQSMLAGLLRTVTCPLVIDADALNNLAESTNWQRKLEQPTVITPHPGEWERMCGVGAGEREAQCLMAIKAAQECESLTVVLKGHRTLITDGQTAVLNATGTPALAVAGSGDVLTGIITGLICQGLSPRDAAHLAVHVHGEAAEAAQYALKTHVVLPTELIQFIGTTLVPHIAE